MGYRHEFMLSRTGGPSDVMAEFRSAKGRLDRLYNSTSMTATEEKEIEKYLIQQAVGVIINGGGYDTTFTARKNALDALYNASAMTADQERTLEHELVRRECTRIEYGSGTFREKKAQLDRLYNGSSMTATEEKQAEGRLIDAEANRIIGNTMDSMYTREQQLNQLYQQSSMTSDQLRTYVQRLHDHW
jgi:hypothetical protein